MEGSRHPRRRVVVDSGWFLLPVQNFAIYLHAILVRPLYLMTINSKIYPESQEYPFPRATGLTPTKHQSFEPTNPIAMPAETGLVEKKTGRQCN